jgi:uncharacterized membrane protein YhaH (DUF805 family)
MGLGWILFGLDGRLNRKPYWIASIILLVLALALVVVGLVIGGQMMHEAFMSGGSVDGATAVMSYPGIIAAILVLYPATALMVKRFHDIGRSGKWVLLLLVPTLGKAATDLLGFTGQALSLAEMGIDMGNGAVPGYLEAMQKQMMAELRIRPLEFAVDSFNFLVGLWFFVWLGFFRGTSGSNAHGNDPLMGPR